MGEDMNAQTILSFHDLEQYFKDGWENQLFAVVVFVDIQGVIRLVNKTVTKVFGYQPEEMVGQKFTDMRDMLIPTDTTALIERFKKIQ